MVLALLRLARSAPPVSGIFSPIHRAIAGWSLARLLRRGTRPVDVVDPAEARAGGGNRLMLDVWSVGRGSQAGVQRVSQQFAAALAETAPPGWTALQHPFRAAHQPDNVVRLAELGRGDVFLALDTNLDGLPRLDGEFKAMRERGGRCIGVVHDLLPLSNPEWFKLGFVRRFQHWALWLGENADHLLCSSQATAAAARHWLPGWSERAADISIVSLAGTALTGQAQAAAPAVPAMPYLLMVGTIEPRKDHASVLAAFEQLWAGGVQLGLVIAGRPGWYTEWFQSRLRRHRELGSRLVWHDNIDDAALAQLYGGCAGVIAASLAEGFGLPIAEAANFGKPALARNIPPFVEQASPDVTYFGPQLSTDDLARAIAAFAATAADHSAPPRTDGPQLLQDSAGQIWAQVLQAASCSDARDKTLSLGAGPH